MNYYPWNLGALTDWIKGEIKNGISQHDLENELEVSPEILHEWLTTPASLSLTATITLSHMQSIARYRHWTVDKTAEWLGIGTAHLDEIIKRAAQLNPGLKPLL